ncbi:hypothetical protein D9758_012435 [Tetrapyrgos nigripes]|uniref:DUF6533 domain-containing protein n=1 Tax=Tetrapyrgos nigripes TaxID=182062 RepID=A0A8H5CZS7_9AGAR|nr:hypothetical protein D9758_012435 [Tetrapyrgos nigripes]
MRFLCPYPLRTKATPQSNIKPKTTAKSISSLLLSYHHIFMDQGSNPGVNVGIEGQMYMYLLGIIRSFLLIEIISDDEINYIWTRPKILSSYCFLLIRYVSLLGEIPVTVVKFSMMSTSVSVNFNQDKISCRPFDSELACLYLGSLCLRIYALYERSRRILVIMIVATLLFTGITTWQGLDQGITRMELHPEGCVVTVPLDTPDDHMDTTSSL